MKTCARCQAPLETPLACSACGALQSGAPTTEADPFALFGLELAYPVDTAALGKRLLRFTRMVHPDFFATAGEQARLQAERATASLNAAHAVLSNDAARADWLVTHLGGPDEQAERSMPKPFLLEVLEWNEMLEAARDAAPGTPERSAVELLATELEGRRAEIFRSIARDLDPLPEPRSPRLVAVRQELNAARYLDKTLNEILALRVAQSLSS
jgi:DnaJ-domain-containing protein 1